MKYHIVVLGCQMNISDSERVRALFEKLGYTFTESEDEADILGVIACSVRQRAIDKVYARIHKWNKMKRKQERNILTFLSGCVLESDEKKFLKTFDFVFKMGDLDKLPDLISNYGVTMPGNLKNRNNLTDFWHIDPQYANNFDAYVPIQNGCNNFCTYCAVPYTRGRELSRSSQDIISEVKSLIDRGYKQITLLGQNVNSYGSDKNGEEISFNQLLTKIGEYGDSSGKEFLLYFTAPHPKDFNEDLLYTIKKYKCLANWVHFPIQSGDNQILKKMNRNYTVEEYEKSVNKIREILPEATLFTDIIVGFTGETEEAFLNTKKAMEKFLYNMAYIAIYSPRPGAQSHKWDDDVPLEEKKERLHRLSDVMQEKSLEYNKNLLGKNMRILLTSLDRKGEYYQGVTEGKIVTRVKKGEENLVGQFVNVKISEIAPMSIEGVLVE
ncbi:MAG: tRNA (N6-isopentenyl adenosine(37)-C2)-methylthiotransferase MiaB [Spirochaetales bacterium]|nr:tRNA (N6-isopentenyl adenosine(37)-C2)-methylthiotransferase MiaB [Spirochaetales bacterium]